MKHNSISKEMGIKIQVNMAFTGGYMEFWNDMHTDNFEVCLYLSKYISLFIHFPYSPITLFILSVYPLFIIYLFKHFLLSCTDLSPSFYLNIFYYKFAICFFVSTISSLLYSWFLPFLNSASSFYYSSSIFPNKFSLISSFITLEIIFFSFSFILHSISLISCRNSYILSKLICSLIFVGLCCSPSFEKGLF